MKKLYLTILAMMLIVSQQAFAASAIGLKFNRTGTDASSVAITVVDENGNAIEGATATLLQIRSVAKIIQRITVTIYAVCLSKSSGGIE